MVMVQESHFENHWSRVLCLRQICSIEQIRNFDLFKSIYPRFMDEETGAQGIEVNDPKSHSELGFGPTSG